MSASSTSRKMKQKESTERITKSHKTTGLTDVEKASTNLHRTQLIELSLDSVKDSMKKHFREVRRFKYECSKKVFSYDKKANDQDENIIKWKDDIHRANSGIRAAKFEIKEINDKKEVFIEQANDYLEDIQNHLNRETLGKSFFIHLPGEYGDKFFNRFK